MNPKVTMGVRILFGVFCLIFGLNKFIGFLPMPAIAGDGGELMRIYFSSGFMTIIGVLEVLGGIALLSKKYIPIALTIITAIMFNAFVFHALHDVAGIGGAALGLILSVVLIYAYKPRFLSLMSA